MVYAFKQKGYHLSFCCFALPLPPPLYISVATHYPEGSKLKANSSKNLAQKKEKPIIYCTSLSQLLLVIQQEELFQEYLIKSFILLAD